MSTVTPSSAAALPVGASPPVSADGAGKSDREKLHETAQAFEALFMRQMLAAARATSFSTGDDEGAVFGTDPGTGTFRQMQDENFADITSKTGALGFATMIEAQMARFLPTDAAAPADPAATGTPSTTSTNKA